MKTIKQINKEVEELRERTFKGELLSGEYGLNECVKSIEWDMKYLIKDPNELYIQYVKRAMTEPLFNIMMIVACEFVMKKLGLIF